MDALVSGLQQIGTFLVAWSLVSVAAVAPVAHLFRRRAAANDRQARALDRGHWLAEAARADAAGAPADAGPMAAAEALGTAGCSPARR